MQIWETLQDDGHLPLGKMSDTQVAAYWHECWQRSGDSDAQISEHFAKSGADELRA